MIEIFVKKEKSSIYTHCRLDIEHIVVKYYTNFHNSVYSCYSFMVLFTLFVYYIFSIV